MEQTLDRGRESPPIPSLRNGRSSGRSFHVGFDSKLSDWTHFTLHNNEGIRDGYLRMLFLRNVGQRHMRYL